MINKNNGYLNFLSFGNKKEALLSQPHCPRCSAALVVRTNHTDGHLFYGCSNYPKCRFTKSIDATI